MRKAIQRAWLKQIKENFEGNLSEELENNKQYSLEVGKNEAIAKPDKSNGNSHSNKLAIDNLPMLLLILTMKITDLKQFASDELYGLNKTADRIWTE